MKPLLNDIALFVEAVNAGNFTQAAVRLEMPASTLSRRVAVLEKHIGFKLLNRTTRRVETTAEGQAYYQRCQSLVEEAGLAHEAIVANRTTVTGTLRLACTGDFANLYLAPCISTYIEANPGVSLDLSLSSRAEDLLANQLDMAIRLGPLRDSSLVAHPLGTLQAGIYASPLLLQATPAVQHPHDLNRLPCVRLGNAPSASTWVLSSGLDSGETQTFSIAVTGRVLAGGPQIAMQLIERGLGVGLLDKRLAQPRVESGHLVQLLKDWQPAPVPVHAVTLSRLMPARVRCFIDLLRQALLWEGA